VTVTDANGCTAVNTLVVENNTDECAHIEGFVLADWDSNCNTDPSDTGLGSNLLRFTDATGTVYHTSTTNSGFYRIRLAPNTYLIEVVPPNNLWVPCQNAISVSVGQGETATQDFLLQPTPSALL
jgi:hypothetical protein